MISIINTFKKSLFIVLVSILTLSIFTNSTYAGNPVSVTRGNTASISWNVNNATCAATVPSYSSAFDNISSDWSGSKNGQSSQTFPKVTAGVGSYTFYCTVPNNSGTGGTCTGTPGVGAQNTCWDSALLTVTDCLPGSVWVPGSLSCVTQVCTANTQTTYGCSGGVTNGNVTHTCDPNGTTASGACTLTSCNNGTVQVGNTCVCPSGQNMISGSCVTPGATTNNFNVSPSTACSIANGASGCPMTLTWSVSGSTGIKITDCSPSPVTIAGAGNLSSAGSFAINVGISGGCYRIYDLGTGVLMGTINISSSCASGNNYDGSTGRCETTQCVANAVNVTAGCTQVANGSVTRNCNGYGTGWTGSGVCTLTSCVSGWTPVSGACVPIACPNGAVDAPSPCTQCAAGMVWNTSNGQCEACNGGCSGAGGSQSNPNGSLTCTNGANNPRACNTCTGIKNFISNSCQTPVSVFSNAITDCTISNNQPSCPKNISWTTSGSNSIRLENCTTNTNVVLANNISGGLQSLNNVTINYPGTCLRIMDINNNYEIARTTVNANCNDGWSWNASQGKCRPSACAPHNGCENPSACDAAANKNYFPALDDCLVPRGEFASALYTCTIIDGQSSCQKPISWNTTNTLAVTLRDSSGAYISVLGSGAYTYNTGGGVTVPYPNATYHIYDINGTGNVGTNRLIDSVTINASCSSVSTFVGGVCAPILCNPGEIKTPPTCPQTDPNGTVSQTCNTSGTAWNASCAVTACNSGYQNIGGECKPIPCPVSNGCSNAPTCNSATGMNYITTIPGCRVPTGNVTSANGCDIINNRSTCISNITWTAVYTSALGVRLENCTGGGNALLYTGNATNYNFNVAHGTNCLRLLDASTGAMLGPVMSLTGTCDSGTTIHASGKCKNTTCPNGCLNAPDCNSATNKNYIATPLPDGSCVTPTASFTSTPRCTIDTNAPNCLTTLSWTTSNGVFRFEDCDNASGDLGAYLPNVASGVGSGQVTVPYDRGCYRLVDKGTGWLVSTGNTVISDCKNTDQWSGSAIKCLQRLYITATDGNRYFGDAYTFNWNTNADTVNISHSGNSLDNIAASAGSYQVSGINPQPPLTDNSNNLIFRLTAKKLDLADAIRDVSISLLYKAVATIGTPTMTGGIVSVPLSCSYSRSFTLNNTDSGAQLMSVNGLNKASVSTDTYTCPLASCNSKVTLNCLSDTSDSESAVLDLAGLRAHINSFSITPTSLEKGSINNKISFNWNVSSLDNCFITVSASSVVAEDIAEAATLNAIVRANNSINPLTTNKSKDSSSGSNILNNVVIKHAKVFSLACGDTNRDGIPDGTYAGDTGAIKKIKLNISDTKEQ